MRTPCALAQLGTGASVVIEEVEVEVACEELGRLSPRSAPLTKLGSEELDVLELHETASFWEFPQPAGSRVLHARWYPKTVTKT